MTPGLPVRLKQGGPTMTTCGRFPGDEPDDVRVIWTSKCGERLYTMLNFKAIVCLIDTTDEDPR